MKLAKRTKEYVAVVGTIVFVASTSVGVVKYWENQGRAHLLSEHNREIQELARRIGTIERRLGDSDDFLDVRNLWVDEGHIAKHLHSSIYYGEDEFYAADTTDESHWTYEKTTDQALLTRLVGNEEILNLLHSPQAYRIHLWHGKPMQEIAGMDLLRSVFPYIAVQRMSREAFAAAIQQGIQEGMQVAERAMKSSLEDSKKEEMLRELEEYFMSDTVLKLFVSHYSILEAFKSLSEKIDYELLKLQKIGNVLYAQYRTTLSDISVGDREFDNYFIYQEIIMISTTKDLFVLEIRIPTSEKAPRDSYFQYATQWLGEFAILRDR